MINYLKLLILTIGIISCTTTSITPSNFVEGKLIHHYYFTKRIAKMPPPLLRFVEFEYSGEETLVIKGGFHSSLKEGVILPTLVVDTGREELSQEITLATNATKEKFEMEKKDFISSMHRETIENTALLSTISAAKKMRVQHYEEEIYWNDFTVEISKNDVQKMINGYYIKFNFEFEKGGNIYVQPKGIYFTELKQKLRAIKAS